MWPLKKGGIIINDFDFCISRALDASVSTYYKRDWSKAVLVDSEKIFDRYLNGNRILKVSGINSANSPIEFRVTVHFSANDSFDYFTSKSYIHDGTLLFIKNCYEEIVSNVCKGSTHPLISLPPCNQSEVEYTLGRFVMLNEHGNFGNDEKPWAQTRTTILLPIKYRIKLKNGFYL